MQRLADEEEDDEEEEEEEEEEPCRSFHILTVLSFEPVATNLPSGLHETQRTVEV